MLATFADLYRQEVGATEDVYRTLPFFGTALSVLIATIAYAAARLPAWQAMRGTATVSAFLVATLLLALAILEGGCVLVWLALRAFASSHLLRSLIWALSATTVIFVTDKLGLLSRARP